MSSRNTPPPPSGGDGQVLGQLVAAFAGVFLTALVDFGVPLTDAQRGDLLSMVFYGWALFAGIYAWVTRGKNPVTPPQPPIRQDGSGPISRPAGSHDPAAPASRPQPAQPGWYDLQSWQPPQPPASEPHGDDTADPAPGCGGPEPH